MLKRIRSYINRLPSKKQLFKGRLSFLESYFDHRDYWHLRRKNVSLAVAIGLFCGLMPGPTQMVSALLVAYLLRAHLPIAIITTLYSNPFTYAPLYYLAYLIGKAILGATKQTQNFSLTQLSSWNFSQFVDWLHHSATYLLLGVPILGLCLAIPGYGIASYIFKCYIKQEKQHRRKKYSRKQHAHE